MKNLKKATSLILAFTLCAVLFTVCAPTGVFAATPTTYTLKQLVDGDHAKILGRTRMEDTALYCEWTDTGFEVNVEAPAGGTDFTVSVNCTHPSAAYVDIIVDGDESTAVRGEITTAKKTVSVPLTAGVHNVRVIRDCDPDKYNKTYTFQFESVSFEGELLEKPADKDFYIEFIGDSYTNGSGTLGPYTAGTGGHSGWKDSSGLYSLGYVAADELDADFSIVAMGGYGVLTAASLEAVTVHNTMRDLYPYVGAQRDFDDQKEPYDFARKADLVFIALGSNDGVARMPDWEAAAREMLAMVMEAHGADVPIVWASLGSGMTPQKNLLDSFKAEYPNLHTYRAYTGGNGGNALGTQYRGHMTAAQETQLGKDIANYLIAEGLVPKEALPSPVYEHEIAYYADGHSDGNGSAASPFTYIKDAEQALYDAVAQINGDDGSISAKIYVKNDVEWVPANVSGANDYSFTGFTNTVKSKDGNEITIEIIGIDSKGDGSKPGMTVNKYNNASNPWRMLYNSYRFENIQITGTGDGEEGAFATLYCFSHAVTFDTGAEIFDSSVEGKKSNDYLSVLHGTRTTTSYNVNTAASAEFETGSNIIINSGHFKTVSAIGIGATGAYGPKDPATDKGTTDLSQWNYNVYGGKTRDFNVTVNGGRVENLQTGTYSQVTGRGVNVNYFINGGTVDNLKAGPASIAEYSKIQYADVTVNVRGGTVVNYLGLTGGDDGATYNGSYTLNMTGGRIGVPGVTTAFKTAGNNVTAASITNNISGGYIYAEPRSKSYNALDGVFLGGYKNTNVTTLTNNVSGGEFLVCAIPGAPAGIYFGGENGFVCDTQTNNVTSGTFIVKNLDASVTSGYVEYGVFFGGYSSRINTLNNNIYFCFVDCTGTSPGYAGKVSMVGLTKDNYVKKLTNVLGYAGTDVGPCFAGLLVHMAGTMGSIGEKGFGSEETPDPTDPANISDEIVLSTTVHYMESTGSVHFNGLYSSHRTMGSVNTVVNNGLYQAHAYFGGSMIYGHNKTTVNGGFYCNVVGAGAEDASTRIYDGSELIINDFHSYAEIADKYCTVWGGSKNSYTPTPVTPGRKAVSLVINGGSMPARCYVYGGSEKAAINGDVHLEINGGINRGAQYAGSESGDITGNVSLTVTGGTIGGVGLHGGSKDGSITGSITNYLKGTTGIAYVNFYGGSNGGTVNGNIYNNISGGTYQYYFYCGSESGIVNGDIINNITGGVQNQSVVCGSYAGTQNGDIRSTYSSPNTDLIKNYLFATNRTGTVNGSCDLLINSPTGNIIKTLFVTPETGSVSGNVTVTGYNGNVSTVKRHPSGGTVGGDIHFGIDLSKTGWFVLSGDVGVESCGEYNTSIKGGHNLLLLTSGSNLEFDSADTSSGNVTMRMYSNAVAGRTYVKLPATVDRSRIKPEMKPDGGLTGQIVKAQSADALLIVGAANIIDSYLATFTLDDALTANIFVPVNGLNEVMAINGRATWSYTFLGETKTGYFTADSAVRNIDGADYYRVSFGVPTGRFDESVAFTCDGGADKTFTVRSLIEAGEAQYADDGDIKALFSAVKNYGAEAAAVFYGGEATDISYDNTEALIAKYDTEPVTAANKYIKATNLLLKDKVSVQFYLKADDISAVTKITFNGIRLGEDEYTLSTVTNEKLLSEYDYLLSVPVKAKDMYKPFTVALCEGETKVDEFTSAVGNYCKTYINAQGGIGAKYAGISKALLAYIDSVKTATLTETE